MNILKRYEQFRGHLPTVVEHLFVCAECGGRLVSRDATPDHLHIACGAQSNHEGMVTPEEYAAAHPPLADNRADEIRALLAAAPKVRKAVTRRGAGLLWSE